jgi:hypothetical protein
MNKILTWLRHLIRRPEPPPKPIYETLREMYRNNPEKFMRDFLQADANRSTWLPDMTRRSELDRRVFGEPVYPVFFNRGAAQDFIYAPWYVTMTYHQGVRYVCTRYSLKLPETSPEDDLPPPQ